MRQLRGFAAIRRAIKHPSAFLHPLQKPGVAKKPQMPANAGLTLSHDFRDFADGQFGFRQQKQKTQPARVTGGAKKGEDIFHLRIDINISLYLYASSKGCVKEVTVAKVKKSHISEPRT